MSVEIYFDGACEPKNPGGTASFGYLIKKDGKIINHGSGIVGSGEGMTNNVGEYRGIIEGVKALSILNLKEKILIQGDSNIVCKMVSKEWGWNKKRTKWLPHKNYPHLKQLLDEILKLLEGFEYKIEWIPREKNQEADALSKEPLIKAGIIKPEMKPQKEKCPKCNGYLVKRKSRFGFFFGCSKYPQCKFIKSICEPIENNIKKSKKEKREEGSQCPKNCDGKLLWCSKKITAKRLKKAYHFEKWLKCDKCKSVFFDEKYKVIHKLDPGKKLF